MLRTPVRPIVSAMAVALLLTACVPQEATPERQSLDDLISEVTAANAAADADGHDHDDHDHGEEPEADEDATAEPAPGDAVGPTSEPTAEPAAGPSGAPSSESAATQTSDEPEGPVMEQHNDFDITVTLSSTCVEQGAEMTIEVDTGERNTGVVYLAYYAGGESGAPPPWGEGHGGNSGDLSDEDGRYHDTWVVSTTAPAGPARVEVMAGRNNGESQKSTAVVRFEVAEAGAGGCDS